MWSNGARPLQAETPETAIRGPPPPLFQTYHLCSPSEYHTLPSHPLSQTYNLRNPSGYTTACHLIPFHCTQLPSLAFRPSMLEQLLPLVSEDSNLQHETKENLHVLNLPLSAWNLCPLLRFSLELGIYSCFPWPLALCLHHTMIFRVLFRQLHVICICMDADVVFMNASASSDLMFIVCLFVWGAGHGIPGLAHAGQACYQCDVSETYLILWTPRIYIVPGTHCFYLWKLLHTGNNKAEIFVQYRRKWKQAREVSMSPEIYKLTYLYI